MARPEIAPEVLVEQIRSFNRFYTAHLGALEAHLLDSPFTLTEARLLFELGHRGGVTAAVLARDLGIDPAYLSRIVRRFAGRGLVSRAPDPADGRGRILVLTASGKVAFDNLVRASRANVGRVANAFSPEDCASLAAAMAAMRGILGRPGQTREPAVIRSHRMGDVSWIVHRHATLYRDEYGWTEHFEALVTEVAADFLKSNDPAREHCWVADRAGAILGSVFLVDAGGGIGKLRLLYVEPAARGEGIGRRLVEECVGFARRAGYRRMTLWTNDCLTEARCLYNSLGFEQVSAEPHADFGPPMIGQVLERDL